MPELTFDNTSTEAGDSGREAGGRSSVQGMRDGSADGSYHLSLVVHLAP